MILIGTPPSILKPCGGMYLNTPQADLVHNTETDVEFDQTIMGFTDGIEDGDNHWIKPEVAGLYHIVGLVTFEDVVAAKLYHATLNKNAAAYSTFYSYSGSSLFGGKEWLSIPVSNYLWLNKTDYVKVSVRSYAGVDTVGIVPDLESTFLQCIRQR